MQWLVDIDTAIADGVLSAKTGAELKRRTRNTMVGYAINAALFTGVVMVIGGTVAWLDDRWSLAVLGIFLTVLGALTLVRGGVRLRLVANATSIVGSTLAIVAAGIILRKEGMDPLVVGLVLGLPAVMLGHAMRRATPHALSVLGGWILLLGATAHVIGLLATKSELDLGWLVLHYAGAVAIACGTFLNVRFVTALAMIPLAASLSSRTIYASHATYSVTIYETTLTIVQMGLFVGLALFISAHVRERFARHARTIGHLSFIWMNMAFWIGSLWGDVVGQKLWGPQWNDVTAGIDGSTEKLGAWNEAMDAFNANAIAISSDAFVIAWAVGILAAGAWGAFTARRAVLNTAVTFGAIHFYTQYFERLEITPGAIIIAGIIAVLSAWALWEFNRWIVRRQPATASMAVQTGSNMNPS